MSEPLEDIEAGQAATAVDSHAPPPKPSRKPALLREADLLERTLLNVREAAFLLRASTRSVWRAMSDPKSKFPAPRRFGGRTLLVRDELLAYIAKGGHR